MAGVAVGFKIVGLLNDGSADHAYRNPSIFAKSCTGSFAQIEVSLLATRLTKLVTLTLTESVLRQPLLLNSTVYHVVVFGNTDGVTEVELRILEFGVHEMAPLPVAFNCTVSTLQISVS